MDKHVVSHDAWKLKAEPRRWQEVALHSWLSDCRGIAAVVTGAGKTMFAFMCMLEFRKGHPDGVFIIVVPTLALMDQWYVSLIDELGVADNDIATYSGESHPDAPSLINLMVLNTARAEAPRVSANATTMLIVDECHRAASRMNALALTGTNVATLGLSATPERQYDSGLEEQLVPALGPIIIRYGYDDALRDRVISRFDLVNVAISLNSSEKKKYDTLTRRVASLLRKARDGEANPEALTRALRTRASVAANATMRIPMAVRLVDRHRGVRTIIFHERIDAAEEIYRLLVRRKVSATIYHSMLNPIVRRDNLHLFRRGLFDVLVTCRALDEGTNVPETSVAVIASSTASARQRVQRLGRVLRPAPGKASATIYTIYATDVEERRLVEELGNLSEADSVTWLKGRIG